MAWSVEFTASALKDLRKLDRNVAERITLFLQDRIAASSDPRKLGKVLKGAGDNVLRYRVGDYRIICEIRDSRVVVLVLRVAHRRDAYR